MSAYDFSVKMPDGEGFDLSQLNSQAALIVNTATKCGFATQFDGLEKLHKDYKERGFTVLGFPSDQFKQEPASDDEMVGVCKTEFGVTFPMFAKVNVNGPQTDPLYTYLKKQKGGLLGGSIKWNFTKFLIDKHGTVIKRYAPTVEPVDIENDIVRLLEK